MKPPAQLNGLARIYREFPRHFWAVVGVSFIDRVGHTMLFPFFSLYITARFKVGMTEAGIVLGILSLFGMFGNVTGGALADRLGRRKPILFGLVASAVSTLSLGLAGDMRTLYVLAVFVGLLSRVAGPAHHAMIADMLPEKQRAEGFAILRVTTNLAWMVGPVIGGFVATRSYLALFITDAVASCVVALLFYHLIPETRPEPHPDEEHESLGRTFIGYLHVLADRPYLAFVVAMALCGLVYIQLYNTLSVYLRDVHGLGSQHYGLLMTSSAMTVILFQFWTIRRLNRKPAFLMMALGSFFYLVGFSLFGVAAGFWLFALNIVIVTVGEMIVIPLGQALAAAFAPEQMRGRYMAVYGLAWSIPEMLGPAGAGLILDNYDPNLLWYLCGLVCAVPVLALVWLQMRIGRQERFAELLQKD